MAEQDSGEPQDESSLLAISGISSSDPGEEDDIVELRQNRKKKGKRSFRKTLADGASSVREGLSHLNSQIYNAYLKTNRLHTIECVLQWKNIVYNPPETKLNRLLSYLPWSSPSDRTILNDISGYAEPGKMVAILGASGAGKSSLMRIIAKQIVSPGIEGEFLVNEEAIDLKQPHGRYSKITGFVTQAEALLPFLTVYETLFYAAMLTLPRSLTYSEKCRRVNSLIEELGLTKCKDSPIGGAAIPGVSGGERKRVSIGVQLLRDPAILFLDEPTTGMDAKTSLQLVNHLKGHANTYNTTVIMVIHQPRSRIFNQFDNVLVLSPNGRQIYFGSVNGVVSYFAEQGYPCPQLENPADFILDVCAYDFRDRESRAESVERIKKLEQAWADQMSLSRGAVEPDVKGEGALSNVRKEKSAWWWMQVFWLSEREFLNDFRNREYIIVRVLQSLIIGLVLGFIFFQMDNIQSSIYDRLGLLTWLIIVVAFFEIIGGILVFLSHRDVFFYERDSKVYSISAYWTAKQIGLLLYQLLYPTCLIIPVYWLAGFQTDWYKFFIFYSIYQAIAFYSNSFGLLLGALLPPSAALLIGPMSNYLTLIMAGYLVNFADIPIPLIYITYISFARWAFDSVTQNEFRGLELRCETEELTGNPPSCPYTRGEQFLDTLNLSELDYYQDFLILLAFIVTFRVLLYVALRYARPLGN